LSDNCDRWWNEQESLKRSNAIWTGIHMIGWPIGSLLFFVVMMALAVRSLDLLEILQLLGIVGILQSTAIGLGAGIGLLGYWMFSGSKFSVRRMTTIMAVLVNVALFGWMLVVALGGL
jgi:hypothetical protein